MSRWKCHNCDEVVQSDGPLAFGCDQCKTEWVGEHAVWSVTPSRKTQQEEPEYGVAWECAICGERHEGHSQLVEIVFKNNPCEP